MAPEQVAQKEYCLRFKRPLEICMLINGNKERYTIFIYLFGELIASTTLESYKYKQKFRLKLKRSK